MSEGDRSFVIQLWWEFQPQMMMESRTMKPESGGETREEGEVSPRAIESVEYYVHARVKTTEETKGALPREKGKLSAVEMQTEGPLSWEERKFKLVEGQTEWVGSVRETGCRCRLGPTGMGQDLRQPRVRKEEPWEDGGGEPSADLAQAEGPESNQFGPLHLLGPEAKNLSPVQRELRVSPFHDLSPVKENLNEEKKSNPISSDRRSMKQIKGVTHFHNWEEGDRRDDQVEAPPMVDVNSRYVVPNSEDSPSSMISVFGRPLLLGGSSGQRVL